MSMRSPQKYLAVCVLAMAGVSPASVQAQPPVFESLAPADGTVSNDASVTLVGQVTGAVSLTVDGGAVALVGPGDFVAGPYALAADQATAFTLVATAADGTNATLTRTIVHDGTPPSVAVTAPADGAPGSATLVTVTGTASDPHLQGVSVNGVAATLTAGTWSAEVPLQEGVNILRARAEDAAGNVAEATRSAVLDTRGPALAITDPEPGTLVGEAAYTVRGTAADPHLDRVEIDGQAAVNTGGTWSLGVTLSEGDNTVTAEAFDTLGHGTTASVVIRLDTAAPQVHVDVPAEGLHTQAATIDVSGTVSGASAVTVNGDAATVPGDGTFSILGVALVEGENELRARAVGAPGFEALHQRTVVRDTTAPARISAEPFDGAEALPGSRFVVTFSEALAPPPAGAWRLERDDGTLLAATGALDGAELTVSPSALLPPASNLRLVLTTALTDLAGNGLAAEEALTYSTAGSAGTPQLDPLPPYVCADSWTLTGTATAGVLVEVRGGAGGAATRAAADGTWNVAVVLAAGRLHHLVVTAMGGDGVVSPSVTANLVHDCRAPEVISSARAGDAFTVTFSEPMDAATASAAITVSDAGTPLAGSVAISGAVATWTAASPLPAVTLRLDVDVTTTDLAGNALAYPYTHFFEATAASSFFTGTVIDDATGRPLAGALVTVTATDGSTLTPPLPEQTTAADGAFQVPVPPGTHDVSVTRPAYTPALRVTTTLAGEGTELFDPRLTPADEAQSVDIAGGSLDFGDGLLLDVPANAATGSTTVVATALSEQGLPALLPYGWSPRGAVWLDLSVDFITAATLTLPVEAPAGTTVTVAELDLLTLQYRSLGDVQVVAGSVSFAVTALGAYVAVMADGGGLAPPPAVAGEVLGSSSSPAGDEVTSASLTFDPAMVLPTQTSLGTALYTLSTPVASGLPLTLSIQEQLTLLDGTPRGEVPYEADLALYHGDDGTPRARFRLQPSKTARTTPIQLGSEDVSVFPYSGESVRGNVLGPQGGSVLNDEGDRLAVPSGGLAEPTAITLTRRDTADLPLAPPAGGTVDGVVEVDLGSAILQAPGSLALKMDVPPATGEVGVLLHVVDVDGTPYYRAVAEIGPTATGWSTKAIDPNDLPWPGVTEGGQYVFLRLAVPHAFVRGAALQADGEPLVGGLVSSLSVDWIQLTDTAGRYVLPVPLGDVVIDIAHPSNGNAVSHTVTATAGDERLDLDPRLLAVGPEVVETNPQQDDVVPAGIEPTVRFTEVLDTSSLPAGIQLLLDGVPQAVDFLPQGTLVTVIPQVTLLSGRTYELRVGTGLRDLTGYTLTRPLSVVFSTVDPPLPNEVDPTRITLYEPDGTGLARVSGAAGAVPSEHLVFVENRSRFTSTPSATAAQDGSFEVLVEAEAGDVLLFHVLLPGSNEVFFTLGPYVSVDGRAFWAGPDALTHTTSENVTLIVEEGTFEGPARVSFTPKTLDGNYQPPAAIPVAYDTVYAFDLDFGGAKAAKPLHLRLPGSITTADGIFLLNKVVDTVEGPGWMLHDLLWIHDGVLTTEDADVLDPLPQSLTVNAGEVDGKSVTRGLDSGKTVTLSSPKSHQRPPFKYKRYTLGAVFRGTYHVDNPLQGVGFVALPTGAALFTAWSGSMEGVVTRINQKIELLLGYDGILFPLFGVRDDVRIVDESFGTLFDGSIDRPADGTIVEQDPAEWDDESAPIPSWGSPIRFFPLRFIDEPAEGELAEGITYSYDPAGETLTVTGQAGSADPLVQVVAYNADYELDAVNYELDSKNAVTQTTNATAAGSFTLAAAARPNRTFVLAISAKVSVREGLRLVFSEALNEDNPGIRITNSAGQDLTVDVKKAGTNEVFVAPRAGFPANDAEYKLILSPTDERNNSLTPALEIPIKVQRSDQLATIDFDEVVARAQVGHLLFLATREGIYVYDVSDPGNPVPYVYQLVNGVKTALALTLPFGDEVRDLAVLKEQGALVAIGGGTIGHGVALVILIDKLDPPAIALDPEKWREAVVAETVVTDPSGGATQLFEGIPQYLELMSSSESYSWLAGGEPPEPPDTPFPITVDPSPFAPYELEVHGTAKPETQVVLTNVETGIETQAEADEAGNFEIKVSSRIGDRLELQRQREEAGTEEVNTEKLTWLAGEPPAGGLVATIPPQTADFTLNVHTQVRGGTLVTLHNLTRGTWQSFVPPLGTQADDVVDVDMSIEAGPADKITVKVLDVLLGYLSVGGVGVVVSDLAGAIRDEIAHLAPLSSHNMGAYSGLGDPNLEICDVPISDFGTGLREIGVLADGEKDPPISIVGLLAFKGLVMLRSNPNQPGEISFVSSVCTVDQGNSNVHGLAVAQDYLLESRDSEGKPTQRRADLALTALLNKILIYEVSDRWFFKLLGVIETDESVRALTIGDGVVFASTETGVDKIAFRQEPEMEKIDEDGDGMHDWILEHIELSGNTNAPLFVDAERGLAYAGGVDTGLTSLVIDKPTLLALAPAEDGRQRVITRLGPYGVSMGRENLFDKSSPMRASSFRIVAHLPGFIGDEVELDVVSVGPGRLEMDTYVSPEAVPGLPTTSLTVTLKRRDLGTLNKAGKTASTGPPSTLTQVYQSASINVHASYLSLAGHERSKLEDAQCPNCPRHGFLSEDALQLMSGHFVRIGFNDEARTLLRSIYGDKRLDEAEIELESVPLDYSPTVRQQPVRHASTDSRDGISSVMLHSGELVTRFPLVNIRSRGFNSSVGFTCRSGIIGGSAAGPGMTAFRGLRELPDGTVEYRDSSGTKHDFKLQANGRYEAKGLFMDLNRTTTGWDLVDAQRNVVKFDHYERLIAIQDAVKSSPTTGNEMHFNYSPKSRIDSIVDTLGRSIHIDYSPQGFIEAIRDHANREWIFTRDPDGRLITEAHPELTGAESSAPTDFPERQIGWSPVTAGTMAARLRSMNDIVDYTDFGGQQVFLATHTYDPQEPDGRVTRQINGGNATNYDYDFSAMETTVEDPMGNSSVYRFNSDHQMIEYEDELNAIYEAEYQNDFLLKSFTRPLGVKSEFFFDTSNNNRRSQGNLLRKTLSAGSGGGNGSSETIEELVAKYSATTNRPTEITGPNNVPTTIDRLPSGLPQRIVAAAGDPEAQSEISYTYDQHGRIESMTDGNGAETTYEYIDDVNEEGYGYLKSMTVAGDDVDLVTFFERDDLGNAKLTRDPRGVETHQEFNERNQLIERTVGATAPTDGGGGRPAPNLRTLYFYDIDGRLVRTEVPVGDGSTRAKTETEYDDMGLPSMVRREISPGIWSETSFERNKNGNITRETDPLGNVTETEYDERGLPVTITSGLGLVTESFTYDEYGNQDSYTNGRGLIYTTDYDGFNRVMETCDPIGNCQRIQYDDAGNPKLRSSYDTGGLLLAQSDREYDGQNRVIEQRQFIISSGSGGRWISDKIRYDGNSNVVEREDALGRVTRNRYDGANRLIEVTDPMGNITELTLDANGNVTRTDSHEISCSGAATVVTATADYDALNRQVAIYDGFNNRTEYYYNALGQVIQVVDAEGYSTYREYDWLGNKTEEAQPEGILQQWTYDASSRLISYGDAKGQLTTRDYDPLGRLTQVTYPDLTSIQYVAYDGAGNATDIVDQRGIAISQSFDEANQLISRTASGGNLYGATSESYVRDGLYRVIQGRYGDIITDFTYDSLSRLTSEGSNGRIVSYVYDDVGNQVEIHYPSGLVVGQQFDALNRLTYSEDLLVDEESRNAEYCYKGPNLVDTKIFGNNLVQHNNYDAANRLAQHTTVSSVGIIQQESLAWSPRNLKVGFSRGDLGGTVWQMAHDGASRLLHLVETAPATPMPNNVSPIASDLELLETRHSYTYDSTQNLVSRTVLSQGALDVRTQLPPDGSGRNRPGAIVDPSGTVQITYDTNGNMVSKGDTNYHFDFRNRLVQVELNGLTLAEYKYDVNGRRTKEVYPQDGGIEEETVWSGWRELEQYRQGLISKRYTRGIGIDEVVRLEVDGDMNGLLETRLIPHYDNTGNVVALTDAQDEIVGRYKYAPYGYHHEVLADDAPPMVNQIAVVAGQISVEFSEDVQIDPDGMRLTISSVPPVDISSAVELPIQSGRRARRRAVMTPANSPDSGTVVELIIAADSVRDAFLNSLIEDVVLSFSWPGPVVDVTTLLDTAAPGVDELRLRSGHLEISFNEPPDLAMASLAVKVDGQAISWLAVTDGYTLRSETPISEGSHTVTIDPGDGIDRVGKGIVEQFEAVISIGVDLEDKIFFEAVGSRVVPFSTFASPLGFQGRILDEETGLYYFRNRYFDPEVGRFISADPMGYVDGPSMYTFSMNNPKSFNDPLGLYVGPTTPEEIEGNTPPAVATIDPLAVSEQERSEIAARVTSQMAAWSAEQKAQWQAANAAGWKMVGYLVLGAATGSGSIWVAGGGFSGLWALRSHDRYEEMAATEADPSIGNAMAVGLYDLILVLPAYELSNDINVGTGDRLSGLEMAGRVLEFLPIVIQVGKGVPRLLPGRSVTSNAPRDPLGGIIVPDEDLKILKAELRAHKVDLITNAEKHYIFILRGNKDDGLFRVLPSKPDEATMFLRSNPSQSLVLHEFMHLLHWKKVGGKAYIAVDELVREEFVFRMLREPKFWKMLNSVERENAIDYINIHRKRFAKRRKP